MSREQLLSLLGLAALLAGVFLLNRLPLPPGKARLVLWLVVLVLLVLCLRQIARSLKR